MKDNPIKVGICQMSVSSDKGLNISKAQKMIEEAAAANCTLAVLPEMFNCPYQVELFAQYAECYPEGETLTMLAQTAAQSKIVVIGGSVAERGENQNLYNTSFIFNEKGELVGRHRKMHLFDVAIKGGTVFQESSILTAGQDMTVIEAAGIKIGIAICYDIRFPELSRLMTLAGAQILVFPAVFSLSTGPVHWQLLLQSRAVDNQVFVIGASPGNIEGNNHRVYGHSMVVDPWGSILGNAGQEEGLMIVEINLNQLQRIREQLPLLAHRRPDIYTQYRE